MRGSRNSIVALILLLLGAVGWMEWSDWSESQLEAARKQEAEALKQRSDELARKAAMIEQELKKAWEHPPVDKAVEVYGPDQTRVWETALNSEEAERGVMAFFSYLDTRSYIRAYKLDGGIHGQYLRAVAALSLKPPKMGHTASLRELKLNLVYFFKILGKQQIRLLNDILHNEPDIIEPTLHVFYQWYTTSAPSDITKGRPTLETMYAYASYLLDTIGGQSYLLRRDSRTRILAVYYCILVLDRANDQNINPNGIDIRPLIGATYRDIAVQKGLSRQKQYLADLDRLARKYKM